MNHFTLTAEEIEIVWAAMYAMVEDFHAPQERLNLDQWRKAVSLLRRLDVEMNANDSLPS